METATLVEKKTKWVLDPAHSELGFRIKHLMITNVKGAFKKFDATIEGSDFEKSSIHVSVDASSVSTNDDSRDGHLKGADFFDVEKFPELRFESTSFKKTTGDNYELKGNLILKGISREIKLDVEFGGISKDPWGNEKAGFSLTGKINRKDFGLNFNAPLETGGVLLSEEVKINAELQFVNKA